MRHAFLAYRHAFLNFFRNFLKMSSCSNSELEILKNIINNIKILLKYTYIIIIIFFH